MDKAKLFMNGRSQAVRLPKSYRFEGKEVYIKRTDSGILLLPEDDSLWDTWKKNLMKYNETFMQERNQPKTNQSRDGIDEIFD